MKPFTHTSYPWKLAGGQLELDSRRPLVMGIVNVTPDSFSDGGLFAATDAAIAHALQLLEDGADLIDVGGESTRPGADPVPPDEERRRVIPVVRGILRRAPKAIVSIDTSKGEVARAALDEGASVVNDVRGGADPALLQAVAATKAGFILMHMRGTPRIMQKLAQYDDVVTEVMDELAVRIRVAQAAGIDLAQIVVDPGIGFAKKARHNWQILRSLHRFHALGRPICVGLSRKGFLGELVNRPPRQRDAATAGAMAALWYRGYHIARVHDVRTTRDVLTVVAHLELADF